MRARLNFPPAADTPEEKEIRVRAAETAERVLRPYAIEDDEKAIFRRDAFDEIARQGLVGMAVAKTWGGRGLSAKCYYAVLEELAQASMAMAVTVGVTNLISGAISQFGDDTQKKTFLPQLASGEMLGAFSLSEPGAGSDAASLKLSAKKAPGGYVLTGTKCWCSSAGVADLFLVMGRTSEEGSKGISSFLVRNGTAGFRVGKQEKKLGMRASPLAELIFEDCFVPESDRLALEGQGLAVALSQLDSGRISIGVAGTGVAMEALNRAWHRDGQWRGEMSANGVRERLATLYANVISVRALVREAAEAKDRGEKIGTLASSVKYLGSEIAVHTTSTVIDALGPQGTSREWEVERLLRDAKALQIVEGTNQIQGVVLARELDRQTQGL